MTIRSGLICCLLLSSCTLFQPAPVPRAAIGEQASDVGAAPNDVSAGGNASVPQGGADGAALAPASDTPAGLTGTAKLIVSL